MSEGTIRLFGPPSIVIDHEDKLPVMPIKGFALIGYLCMEAGSHRRDKIAALFWPDTLESRRRGNLRTLLYDLNKIAPGLLAIERQTVSIAAANPYEVDLFEIQRWLSSEEIETRRLAANRLRGPFLQDIFLDDADTFETWLRTTQEYWRLQAVELLQQTAVALLREGRLEEAGGMLEQLLRFQPWHEETHQALMRLFAAQGDFAAALQQYQILADVLERELDLTPDPVSVDLRDRIRQARERTKSRLPHQPTPFVGREQEMARVQSLLESREHRLVSLLGPGGIGKTRLAIHIAERVGYLFLDGVFFVSLANVKPSESFLTPIAQALNLHTSEKGDIRASLMAYLHNRELLFILDNFEHLIDQAVVLSDLLAEAASVQLLITSQEALGIRWETQYRLHGLPIPAEGDPDPMAYASTQLFAAASLRADPEFHPESHQAAIGLICRQVDGTPLGIELAGTLVIAASPQEIVREIEHNLALLSAKFKDIPRRHHSMQAVFEYAWALLSAEEQLYLSRLAVFRGGFTAEMASKVTDCPGTILKRLATKSLLFGSDGRYDFHELIRRFAWDKLGADGVAGMAERHGAFFASEMAMIMSQMVGVSQPVMIQKIRGDFANFRAAWDFSLHLGKTKYLSPLLEGLARYFDLTSLFKDGEALMEAAETRLKESDSAGGADILADLRNAKARFYNKQSRFEEAIAIVQVIAENEAYQVQTRAFAYLEWGWALWHTGKFEVADSVLGKGQQLALRAEVPLLMANNLRNQGIVAWYQSDFETARTMMQQAYELHESIGDLQGTADALNNLALVAGDQGDYLASLNYLQRAIQIKKELGDRNGRAISSGNLATLYLFLGLYGEAEKRLLSGITLAEKVGNVENLGHMRTNLCGLLVLQGRFDMAKVEAKRALQLVRQTGDTFVEGYVLEFWGLAHEGEGELSRAETLFKESLALRRQTGLDEMIYHVLGKLTHNAMLQGKHETAVATIREMDALIEGGHVKNVRVLQSGTFICFRALDACGDPQALSYLRQAVHHLESQANKIADPDLRRSFLQNIEEHRSIAAAKREFLLSK